MRLCHKDPLKAGLAISMIVLGLVLLIVVSGQWLQANRFDGAAITGIVAVGVIAAGVLSLDEIRCRK